MDFKNLSFAECGLLYLFFGFFVSNSICFASRWLEAFSPSELPWWIKLFFPLHVNFREYNDPGTWGTFFWGRTRAREVLGISVITLIWPLRVAGALLGWALLYGLDGVFGLWRTAIHWRG